jgi:hypothetical protein
MSRFWKDAVKVLETASVAPRDGVSGNLAVILDPAGGLRILPAEGWTIEGLRAEYGGTVYHVIRTGHDVCVEGRAAGMSCTLRGPFVPPPEQLHARNPANPAALTARLATTPWLSGCGA